MLPEESPTLSPSENRLLEFGSYLIGRYLESSDRIDDQHEGLYFLEKVEWLFASFFDDTSDPRIKLVEFKQLENQAVILDFIANHSTSLVVEGILRSYFALGDTPFEIVRTGQAHLNKVRFVATPFRDRNSSTGPSLNQLIDQYSPT